MTRDEEAGLFWFEQLKAQCLHCVNNSLPDILMADGRQSLTRTVSLNGQTNLSIDAYSALYHCLLQQPYHLRSAAFGVAWSGELVPMNQAAAVVQEYYENLELEKELSRD